MFYILSKKGEFRTKRKLNLKNIFVKKYKVSNENSTRSLNQKENEMYYHHHHDHSYTKNKIDFVNDDCLAAIFMYVPALERPKIALVCQKWKRALDYSWGNVKKIELTHWKHGKSPSYLRKHPTLHGQLMFFRSLLSKCGRYLTQLDVTSYEHCIVVPVANKHCPNLIKLRFRTTIAFNVLSNDAFSCLSKLKVLAIIFEKCVNGFIPLNIIYSLRSVSDTLTDLTLLNFSSKVNNRQQCEFSKETFGVIRELKALKKVDIFGIKVPSDLHKYLNDEMSIYTVHDIYFHKVLTHNFGTFADIHSLCLKNLAITDDGLYTIYSNLKRLRLLGIAWEHITNFGVLIISKMNLTVFNTIGINNVIDSSSLILLEDLIRLKFVSSNNITDDVAIKILENSPKLRMLYVLNEHVTVEFIKKAAQISEKRKFELTVGVPFMCDKKQYETQYFSIVIKIDGKRIE